VGKKKLVFRRGGKGGPTPLVRGRPKRKWRLLSAHKKRAGLGRTSGNLWQSSPASTQGRIQQVVKRDDPKTATTNRSFNISRKIQRDNLKGERRGGEEFRRGTGGGSAGGVPCQDSYGPGTLWGEARSWRRQRGRVTCLQDENHGRGSERALLLRKKDQLSES